MTWVLTMVIWEHAPRIYRFLLRLPSASVVSIKAFPTASFYLIKLRQQVKSVGTQIHTISTINFLTTKQKSTNMHQHWQNIKHEVQGRSYLLLNMLEELLVDNVFWETSSTWKMNTKKSFLEPLSWSMMNTDKGLPTSNKLSAFISFISTKWS